MNIIPYKVKNYILINYENLIYNYDDTLNDIQQKFNLIKKNDTLSNLQSMTDQDSALIKMNPVCNLKSAVKVGDVVIMSMRESM